MRNGVLRMVLPKLRTVSASLLCWMPLLCVAFVQARGQAVPANLISAQLKQDFGRINENARSSDFAYERLRFLCESIGPRLSGSEGATVAVSYVAKQMQNLGLDVHLEPVTVRHWQRGKEEAELIVYAGQSGHLHQRIAVTALGNTPATPSDGISAGIVVVESFDQLDSLPAEQIKGRIVLFNVAFDEGLARAGAWDQAYFSAVRYRTQGPARAARRGAIAVLVRSVGPDGTRLLHTGEAVFEAGDPQIPAGAITAEDASLIADLAGQGEVLMHLVLTPNDRPPIESANVIADLKGSEFPNQIVIVSAHLDSWDLGTGAIDDGAGVVAAMDAIRIIKEINPHPKRTIRFIAWMNEENGGAGGVAYAKDYRSELPDHVAAIEIDHGDGRPIGWTLAAIPQRSLQIATLLKAMGSTFAAVRNVNSATGFDLTFMNSAGVPAISPLQEAIHYFDYHHTPADTFDKVRESELRELVAGVASVTYALAEQQNP
jgi:hypothetical protein